MSDDHSNISLLPLFRINFSMFSVYEAMLYKFRFLSLLWSNSWLWLVQLLVFCIPIYLCIKWGVYPAHFSVLDAD